MTVTTVHDLTSLRDRIAAAIDGIRIQRDGDSYKMADAVIAEIGLEVERGGTYEVGGEATSHRYVTDWIVTE